ncbi:MAG: hypothetical protein WDA09_05200 [Bacteriovoracaceae bacterium]
MKVLVLISLLFSLSSVASTDFCSYSETYQFFDELESQGIKHIKRARNHKRFTFLEKNLIHLTITLQSWYVGVSREEAILTFSQVDESNQRGPNAGEVLYYQIGNKNFVLVHYWPGDNEYGAFYELKVAGSYELKGIIRDGGIYCETIH